MATKIRFSFSTESINNAIKRLEEYKEEFAYKNELFVQRLANIGLTVARAKVVSVKGDANTNVLFEVKLDSFGSFKQARIKMSGEDVLFIEFGAGIHYNPTDHPLANEFGYGVGTYPGQTHAYDDYWFYVDEDGVKHMSQGTEAAMPMYEATLEIIKQIRTIAKEVFGG